jgi:hypothetical protein
MASRKGYGFILILLLVFSVGIASAQTTPVKDTKTTGVVKIPKGTTVFPTYTLPNKSIGTIAATMTCDPTFDFVIRIRESYDNGATWTCPQAGPCRGFVRQPAPCVDRITAAPITVVATKWENRDKNGALAPFPDGTQVQVIVVSATAITAEVTVTVEKLQ